MGTYDVSTLDSRALAGTMVGDDIDPDFRASVVDQVDQPVTLQARGIHGKWLRGVDLEARAGEILGIAGLAGAGALELPYVLAGKSDDHAQGQLRLPAISDDWHEVSQAAQLEIPLVPADRQTEAVIAEFSVGENISLSALRSLGRRGRLAAKDEAALVESWSDRLGVVSAGPVGPDLDPQRRQPAEGDPGPLPGRRPARAGDVRADRRRRHRHPGVDLPDHRRPRRRPVSP